METDMISRAKNAIDTLAERDGIPAEVIRGAIQELIAEAQKEATPEIKVLWQCMTDDGNLPSPEELIVWIANVLGYGV